MGARQALKRLPEFRWARSSWVGQARPQKDMTVTDRPGARVVVDPKSAMFVKSPAFDFVGGLMGGGFALLNPNTRLSWLAEHHSKPLRGQEPTASAHRSKP
jgi:Fe-S cluster assembly iron-binding protein IscA